MKKNEPNAPGAGVIAAPNAVDAKLLERAHERVRPRVAVEIGIVREILAALINAGYGVKADDGEEVFSGVVDDLVWHLFGVDEAHIFAFRDGVRAGFVFLVFGNDGWDVVNDYSISLAEVIDPIIDRASAAAGEGGAL